MVIRYERYFCQPCRQCYQRILLTRQSQMESNVRSYPRKLPLAIAKAQGCWVTDVEGTQYLDCLAGAGTLALGHNHPAVIQSIQEHWQVVCHCIL